MMGYTTILVLAIAQVAFAHFGLVYPEWRVDTLSEENEEKYSQWNYPCKLGLRDTISLLMVCDMLSKLVY